MLQQANMGLRILAPYTDSDDAVTVRDGVLSVVTVRSGRPKGECWSGMDGSASRRCLRYGGLRCARRVGTQTWSSAMVPEVKEVVSV